MITHEKLREMYLADLQLPDTFHDRTTPKVKFLGPWMNISSTYTTTPIDVVREIELGRNVWVWSDPHFGHNNIIKYTGRPFAHKDEMDAALIRNYNATVAEDDIVFWCGDISFCGLSRTNSIIESLPGYKIHIIGNHDLERNGDVRGITMNERHLCYALHYQGLDVLFTHYHMDTVPSGSINVHGHIHNKTAHPWNVNVSVEQINFTPINLLNIIPAL